MKAGGANGIRYPGSPSCKQCRLGVGTASSRSSAAGKPLSLPPGKYGRKAEILEIAYAGKSIELSWNSILKGIGGGAPQGVKPAV